MSMGTADLHKAVASLWVSSGLHAAFQAHWAVASRSLYPSLNDKEAAPKTPFPYCVFESNANVVKTRMSGEIDTQKQHVNDHPWRFWIHAAQTSTKSAKQMAADMAEEIMKVFGGHPTVEPQDMTLDNGNLLIVQYQSDYGERESDTVHKWTVEYNIRTDVPVMV